jgi:HEAT repeat protein
MTPARSVRSSVVRATAGVLAAVSLGAAVAHGQDGRDALVAGLRAGDVEARRAAVMRIAETGDSSLAAALVPLLEDRAEVVRATAAGALGRLRSRATVEPLAARLGREKRVFVRKSIASALGEIGDATAVAPLVARIGREKDREARAALVTALGRIGDRAAVLPLRERLGDRDEFVRREAVRALGLVGDASAVPDLARLLARDREADVRRHAAEALARIGGAEARDALALAVRDPDPYVADIAFDALRRLGGQTPPGGN